MNIRDPDKHQPDKRDPDKDIDDLLGDGGSEIGNLYRRLPRYEPPRRLDRAVLGEAARAVHSGKPPRRQRWIFGLGSAAGIVLAAGIAWRIGHDAMNQNEAALPNAAPRVVPVQPITESARAKREEEPAQQAATPAEADVSRADSGAQSAAAKSSSTDELKPALRRAATPNRPATPPAIAAPAPKPAAAPPPPEPFPDAARQREQAADHEKSNAGTIESSPRATTSGAAMEKRAAGAARALSSPTPPSGSVELQRDMQLAPPDWLAHIRQLEQQGRRQQATESLRLFHSAHPDWTIPDDLRDLLE